MKRLSVLCALLCIGGETVYAGGFQIPEMGVRAMGMGNAFTAVADDPTANWYNPAGLGFQHGTAVTAGAVAVMPKVDFTSNASNPLHPTAPASADRKAIFIPHAYMAINTDSNLTAGIGINSPFGLEVKWPTTAVFAGGAQYGRLQAVNVNGNVAFKLNDGFAIAVGVDFVDMYRVDFNGTALQQNFKGTGWGYNVAGLYKTDQLNVGVSYRSSVKISSKGQSTHTATATTGSNAITVTMPDMLNVGVSFHPAAQWTISADADWVNWKKFDKLAFSYNPALAFGAVPSLTVPENWKATWAFRAGAEWAYSDTMRARFGYTYDPTPIRAADFSPLLPGNDRQAVHVGYGVDLSGQVTLDIAYMYVWLADRNQTLSPAPSNWVRNGTYKSDIHLAAASLTYRF